jgi:hypothetical protein
MFLLKQSCHDFMLPESVIMLTAMNVNAHNNEREKKQQEYWRNDDFHHCQYDLDFLINYRAAHSLALSALRRSKP